MAGERMKLKRLTRGMIVATAALGALSVPAAAQAVRFAEPGGNGPEATCPQTDPCEIHDAIEGISVVDGDTVTVLPGTYSVGTDPVDVFDSITIEGQAGQPLPRLIGTTMWTLFLSPSDPSVVRRVHVESTANPGGYSFYAEGDHLIEQVEVVASGTSSTGAVLKDGATFRDSVAVTNLAGASAIITGGPGSLLDPIRITNSTVIGTAAGSHGISVLANSGSPQRVTARNVIARAPGTGIRAVDTGGVGDDDVEIDVAFSNYSSVLAEPPDARVVLLGNNQQTAPLFANAGGGDYRQLPGSATIGAGTSAALLGPLDFEGQPRVQGTAPDIGADEAPDPDSLLVFGGGKQKRKRTLKIPATCPIVNCNIAVAANLVVKGAAKRAVLSRVIKLKDVSASLTAGNETVLTFKLPKKAFKSLRGAKKARLTVAAGITASLGFTGTESASFKFKKAGKK